MRVLGRLLAGLSATLLMEHASSFLYGRQEEGTREREEELRTEMPTTALVRKAAGVVGGQLDEGQAARLGMATHYAFGAAGGPAAALLVGRGAGPVRAGLTVAAARELDADQGANTLPGVDGTDLAFSSRHPGPSPRRSSCLRALPRAPPRRRSRPMNVEVLYFEGCPSHEAFLPRLRTLVAEIRPDAPVELRRVESPEAVQAERFLGSRTVRVDGADVEPGFAEGRSDFGLECRLFRTEEGSSRTPPDEWLRAALAQAGAG